MADSLLLGGRYPETALHRALKIAEICICEMPKSWTDATYLIGSLNELLLLNHCRGKEEEEEPLRLVGIFLVKGNSVSKFEYVIFSKSMFGDILY